MYLVKLALYTISAGQRFKVPPTKEIIYQWLKAEWNKLSNPEDNWDVLLICDFVPTIPWVGVIETWYGTVSCEYHPGAY